MAILNDPLYVFKAHFPRLTARQRYYYILIACRMLDYEERHGRTLHAVRMLGDSHAEYDVRIPRHVALPARALAGD